MSVTSLDYVRVKVTTLAGIDPTTDVAYMAFVTSGEAPDDADWADASWEPGGPPYVLRCLVGPTAEGSTIELPVGSYVTWAKVVDNPEKPVRRAGRLTVF